MGVSHRYLSNLEMALSLSLQALDMFINLGDKNGEAQAYVSIGAIYYYVGDFERSLDYFLKGCVTVRRLVIKKCRHTHITEQDILMVLCWGIIKRD
jgi:tetratricopeptide (TPR) repeat protein